MPKRGFCYVRMFKNGRLGGNDMEAEMTALKTGTSTIGLCFDGGVVVGADHRATMGHFVANKNVQKLFSS